MTFLAIKNDVADKDRANSFHFEKDQQWTVRQYALLVCTHPLFDLMSALVICLNAVTIGAQADYEAKNGMIEELPKSFQVLEKMFCVAFTVELAWRLFAYRGFFFSMGLFWGVFDIFVVTLQLVEELLLLIWQGSGTANMGFLRMVRILKLVRILRVARIIQFMQELQYLVASIMNSMKSLFWTLVLLIMCIYGMSVYFTQLVADYRTNNLYNNVPDDERVMRHFGGLSSSMLSLFQAMSGGVDWQDLSLPLIEHISPPQGFVFCMYIAFTVLALTNVVTGIFIEGVLKNSKEVEEKMMLEGLHNIFLNIDTSSSGRITTEQFRSIFASPHMQRQLENINVNVSEASLLFNLLDDDNSGSIDYNEFVGGCMRLRQSAKAIDIIMVMHETQQISTNMSAFIERADGHFSKLGKLVN